MKKKQQGKSGGVKNAKNEITAKEKIFCEEYIKDFNASRAYKAAGFACNDLTSRTESCKLRQVPRVYAYLQLLQADLEKASGISRLQVLNKHLAIINTSIAQLHRTWITRTEFEQLTDEQKEVIQEIDTKVKTRRVPGKKTTVTVEFVRIKLFDKQKALDAVARMLGYNEPDKLALIADKKAVENFFPFGK